MLAFRLCRSAYPAYNGEGARRVGGRWNSKGVRVLYMSENRSLAALEVLVHLSGTLPDKYILGAADIAEDVAIERMADQDLPKGWSTLSLGEQVATRRLGDAWAAAAIGGFVRSFRNPRRTELRSKSRALGLCANRVCRA